MSIRAAIMVVWVLFVACGDGNINTAEECKDAGGRIAPNPGAGVRCEPNEDQIGTISEPQYFEAPICCRPRWQRPH